MRLPFALAFVLALLLLVASKAGAGTERVDLLNRLSVDVIQKQKDGTWLARKALVHGYSDARIIVCEEFKDKVEANCLIITNDGEAVVEPVRLLEEKV